MPTGTFFIDEGETSYDHERRWNEWVDTLAQLGVAPDEEPVAFGEDWMRFRLRSITPAGSDLILPGGGEVVAG